MNLLLSPTDTIHTQCARVPSCHRQAGVGLVEVLITVIVLAIGFLAAGRMQAQGLRNTQSAYISSQAAFLIKDMSDRMRANVAGVEAGHYDAINTADSNASAPTCATTGSTGQACSPAEIAQLDIVEWSAYIEPVEDGSIIPVLPSGDTINASGSVVKVNDIYRVNLSWSGIVSGEEAERSLSMDIAP